MRQAALDSAADSRAGNLNHLINFLRIPSISTEPKHRPDMDRAAEWLVNRMLEIGFTRAAAYPTDGFPIAYGEWLGAGPDAPTVLVYGHYDVQPTDPDEEWKTPPFEPTARHGNLYARGAADDKGQLYTHLAAAEAFFNTNGAPPVNLKFVVEGEEEIGSQNLAPFIRKQANLLACDAVVISDTHMLNAKTPTIVYGVRGLVYTEIQVRGPQGDLHSGSYGGAVHNPLQVAAEIVAALHDEQGRVTIPGFYDAVRPLTDEERAEMDRIPFKERRFLKDEVGAPALWTGEEGYTVLERIGARPTLEIHGIRGGFTGEGSKTVIPARAAVKASMRLVPDQDPEEIARLFTKFVQKLAPRTVNVEVKTMGLAEPAVIERDTPVMQAATAAFRQGFGAEPVFIRSGGTLPIIPMLSDILDVPVVLMGFGLPDDNLHAPNEKLSLDNFYRGIDTSIHFMSELASQDE